MSAHAPSMNRLEAELRRLYAPAATAGQVPAMVLGVTGAGSWEALARVWQGVQADLQLPAPGIAVNGVDGYQLWFSLAGDIPPARALAFLEGLRRRYLADVPPGRVATMPCDAAAAAQAPHATALPPREAAPGQWSAFVTQDLAPLFADEPCLDLAPTPDAQADLLSRLQGMAGADVERATELLAGHASAGEPAGTPSAAAGSQQDPRRFLLAVMNDPAVELRLRIEAAKALLPFFEVPRGGGK
jgi:hypothetical protein